MTPPVTTEALVEALAYLKPHETNGGTISLKAPKARETVAVIEAALQQVTAERDEYAEALMKVAEVGGWQASAGLAAEVQSALARLRAEGEAKDRARGSDARAVIELCDSVLGNAYIGKGREDALAGRVKAAFMNAALARAATVREG